MPLIGFRVEILCQVLLRLFLHRALSEGKGGCIKWKP